METMNAVIKSVSIDTERCLSAWLTLELDGSGQGFGGYALYSAPWNDEERVNPTRYRGNYAGVFIQRCIEIGGVTRWEYLCGKTIRVRKESWSGPIKAIGHIIKDDWFDPEAEFARIKMLLGA